MVEETETQRPEIVDITGRKARREWVEAHWEEVADYVRQHGTQNTIQYFGVAQPTLKSHGLLQRQLQEADERRRAEEAEKLPDVQRALVALGVASSKERQEWLEEHKEEIAAYIDEHGVRATTKDLHIGHPALKRLRILPRQQRAAEAAERVRQEEDASKSDSAHEAGIQDLQELLLDSEALVFLVIAGVTALGELLKDRGERLKGLQGAVEQLTEALSSVQEDNRSLVDRVNRKFIREGLGGERKFPLEALQEMVGRGREGTRRSLRR